MERDEISAPTVAPMLSVIIPSYNAASTLGEQLEALKHQTYRGRWEIIVSDNRSTDNTAELVEQYAQDMPHLRRVEAFAKQGRSFACNYGASQAQGDVFIFCDGDDVAALDWLETLAAHIKGHPIVAGATEVEKLNPASPWRPNPFTSSSKPVLNFLPYAPGANIAIAREVFLAVGGYSEDIPPCEDIDLAWRLQLSGYKIHDAPDAIMHIRYRGDMKSFWRQITKYGECHSFLYRRFARHGMPRSTPRLVLQKYRWIATNALGLFSSDLKERTRLIYTAAGCWGRLRGSLRYRTFYL